MSPEAERRVGEGRLDMALQGIEGRLRHLRKPGQTVQPEPQARLLLDLAALHVRVGDWDAALDAIEGASSLARSLGMDRHTLRHKMELHALRRLEAGHRQ
jgi:hypothetical protein